MKTLAVTALILSVGTQAQAPPARISSGVMAGQLIHKVMPRFPEAAKQAHVNGAVVMHVIVGEDGTVRQITPVSGPEMLRQSYVDAVKQWVYRPYLLNGRPVPVDTTITMSIQMGGTDVSPKPVQLSSGVMAGQIIHRVMPQYPKAAAWAHVSGSVVLHVIIGEDGIPHEITPVSGPEMLRQPYIDAVKQWVYKPYLLNGRPVPVDTTITVHLQMGAPELPPGRVQLPSGELAGSVLKHPTPNYPHFAADDHISGSSTFHVVVGRDGHVLQVDVIDGPTARIPFEVQAVKRYVYKPYLVNGEPVEVDSTITLQPSFGG